MLFVVVSYTKIGEMTPDGRFVLPPIVAIASGAGVGPLLDLYMYLNANNMELENPVSMYFTTSSVGLFQFFTDLACSKDIPNFSVSAHLTQAEDYTTNFEAESTSETAQKQSEMKLGRLSFDEMLARAPKDAQVFFCGAAGLQWKIEVACAKYKLDYHPGHRYANDGLRECKRVGTCRFVCMCSKFPCCLI